MLTEEKTAELKAAFDDIDSSDNGFLETSELIEMFRNNAQLTQAHKQITEADVLVTVKKYDKSGDGLINFEEFCEMVTHSLPYRPVPVKNFAIYASVILVVMVILNCIYGAILTSWINNNKEPHIDTIPSEYISPLMIAFFTAYPVAVAVASVRMYCPSPAVMRPVKPSSVLQALVL